MERNSVVRKNIEKVFIVGDPGEKVIGTFEGEYDVPRGRMEESMKVLLKNLRQRNSSNIIKRKPLNTANNK
jgi:hypothetical protein